jgi:hypothetical protein
VTDAQHRTGTVRTVTRSWAGAPLRAIIIIRTLP